MARFVYRQDGAAVSNGHSHALEEDGWSRDHPALWEYLTLAAWSDGDARELSTLTVFVHEGMVKVCIHDKDAGMVGFVSAPSWEGLWERLEAALREHSLDWRRDKSPGRRRS